MARARFTEDFDYSPTPQVTIAYLAGKEYRNMKRDAVDLAVAAGKAVEIKSGRNVKETPQESTDGDQAISG